MNHLQSKASAGWLDLLLWLLLVAMIQPVLLLARPETNDNVYGDVEVIEQMVLPHTQPTVGHLIQCLLKCQQWFARSVVLGSKLPSETQETDVPLWYTAQWGGDELRDL